MVSKIQAYLDHKAVAPNLSAYIDGALAPQDKERVERHLAVCPECQRNLATLRQTVSLLRRIPVKRVPRSFTLPMSAQAERAAHRRWALANSFMRVSAAAVSFMLLLLLSTDAVLRFGAISIPDVAPSAAKYAAPRAAEMEAAPEVVITKEVEAVPQVVSTQAPQPLEPTEELVKEPPAAERAAVSEPSPLAEGMGGVGGGAEVTPKQDVTVAAEKALPMPSEAPSEGAFNGERAAVAAPQAAEGTPTAADAAAEGTRGYMGAARPQEAATSPTPTSTAVPTVTETPTATLTATQMPATQPAPIFTAEPAETFASSPLWQLWGTVRLLAGLLAGLLCILFAGLLWTSRKRRI